jgi:hypothetical protein
MTQGRGCGSPLERHATRLLVVLMGERVGWLLILKTEQLAAKCILYLIGLVGD